uniref:TFIIS N-terminal domain-containing protein n=1 Tax=Panagrellus redivivus TaxID=6233 RepID=A0A7E4UYF6_PANRE
MSSNLFELKEIQKYMDQLKHERKIGHALRKLHCQTPSAAVLVETGVEKVVHDLLGHSEHGLVARLLLGKWKAAASEAAKSRKRPANAMAAPLLLRVKQEPISFDAPPAAKKPKTSAPAAAPLTTSAPVPEETDGRDAKSPG